MGVPVDLTVRQRPFHMDLQMRLTCLVLAIPAAAPFTASAQAADSNRVEPRSTLFSVQPSFEGRGGSRVELECAVTSRMTRTVGSRLTTRQADFLERFPRVAGFDVGARCYAAAAGRSGASLALACPSTG